MTPPTFEIAGPVSKSVVVQCPDWTYTFAPQEGEFPATSMGKMIESGRQEVSVGQEIGLGLNSHLLGLISKVHGGLPPGSAPGLYSGTAVKFRVSSPTKPMYGEIRCGDSTLEILCMPYKMT